MGEEGVGVVVKRLPEALVDQIAAGEVVERPASVVKELVENALDAAATRVRVEVRGGGNDWISVSDDGSGMSAADARLAVERHATSKLRHFAELAGIESYGFRGEALPAIASVSRFRLRTRQHDAAQGFEIQIENGKLCGAQAAGGPAGTRIEVTELFAALPARRKFLKRESTEWGHIADALARTALALPQIHFDLSRDEGKVKNLSWPGARAPLDRIAAVLGEKTAQSLVEAECSQGDQLLHAFVSRPDAHRPTGAGIYLFVNGRPVRDATMRHALLQVMRDVLPRGRFPTALLFLESEAGAVDVNVHPAKWEVRFADPRAIHQLVANTVRDALRARGWLGAAPGRAEWVRDAPATTQPSGHDGAKAAASDWVFARPASEAFAVDAASAGPGDAGRLEDGSAAARGGQKAGRGAEAPRLRFAALHLLAQIHCTYLLTESPQGLLLIDQHAAHERVLYERLRARWLAGALPRQALLAPIVLELEPSALEALRAEAEAALQLGFEFELFDGKTLALRAVPELLAERNPEALLSNLAEELRESGGARAARQAGSRILDDADKIFASMACHSARRAGERLSTAEQQALLEALDTIPWAPTCPHGRPVAAPIGRDEIERRFARR